MRCPNESPASSGWPTETMRAPPITVPCECGEVHLVPYGETWTCETCGRRWNTAQIPADEYWGVMREMRRYRLQVIAMALGVIAVIVILGIFVSRALFLVVPIILGAWFLWFMPTWRRRVRLRARNLPKWKLYPE